MKKTPLTSDAYAWGGILGGMGRLGGQTPEDHAKDLKMLIQHMAARTHTVRLRAVTHRRPRQGFGTFRDDDT